MRSPSPEGSVKAQIVKYVSPISPTGGYRLQGSVNGVNFSLLLDTGATVTLLRKDTWERVTKGNSNHPQLAPCIALELVRADGTPLQTHGSTSLTLEFEGNAVPVECVVVNALTSEGILRLKKQRASINLEREELHLPLQGCTITLHRPCTCATNAPVKVRSTSSVEVPAYSELEVMAYLEEPVGGAWLLESSTARPAGVVAACALVQPTSDGIPVRLINFSSDSVTIHAGRAIATVVSAGDAVCLVDCPYKQTGGVISDQSVKCCGSWWRTWGERVE